MKKNMKVVPKNRKTSNNFKKYYLVYTVLFIIIFTFAFSPFFLRHKTFIYHTDGLRQHFTSLAYYGHYLRDILRTIFQEHSLQIPMFDFNIGLGADIITTLHYYVIGDPLNLLSIAVPMKYTEYLYAFLVVFRIYLSGISFSALSFYHRNEKVPTLLGSFVYAFSGWVFFAAVAHPYFVNPMIYFPFILIGIDKIYKKEKPYIFMGAVGLAGLSNFYFFYMICILMVIYAAFRYFVLFSKRSIKDILCWLGKFAGYFAVGFAITCVLLLPVVMLMFGTGRFQADTYVQPYYERRYLEMLPGALIGTITSRYTAIGISAVSMLGIMALFVKRRKETALKIAFFMLLGFFLVPFAGHVFNGFSYATNRWAWAFVLLLAYMFVRGYPELLTLSIKERLALSIIVLAYSCMALLGEAGRTLQNLAQIVLLVLTGMAFLWLCKCNQEKWVLALISTSLAIGIIINGYAQYLQGQRPRIESFEDAGTAIASMDTAAARGMKKIAASDSGFFRYDGEADGDNYNTSMLSKVPGTSYFFSLSSPATAQFQKEMYINIPYEQALNGLDGRVILDRISSVKYFAVGKGSEHMLPYGYNQYAATGKNRKQVTDVYRTNMALPLGYTYSTYIPKSDYEKLDVVKKQQVLLQNIVLEDSILQQGTPVYTDEKIQYKISNENGCKMADGKITVFKKNASVKLNFNPRPNTETYLIVEGLDFLQTSPKARYDGKEWDSLSADKKKWIVKKEKYWSPSSSVELSAESGDIKRTLSYVTKKFNFYCGRHDFLLNMGYHENGISEICLNFKKTGSYTFSGLSVVCQPMDELDLNTLELRKEVLEDVSVGTNQISGSITLKQPKAVLLTIPYSKGWHAYVDGEPAQLKQANTMFMALELTPGTHKILLEYRTPYIIAGLIISILGITVFLILVYLRQVVLSKKKNIQPVKKDQ